MPPYPRQTQGLPRSTLLRLTRARQMRGACRFSRPWGSRWVSLAALVRHLCRRAGMPEALIDVTGLWGAVEGFAITALEAPRSSISTLARHFGFDAIETEGMIRFVMRGRASVVTLTHDDLVAPREG